MMKHSPNQRSPVLRRPGNTKLSGSLAIIGISASVCAISTYLLWSVRWVLPMLPGETETAPGGFTTPNVAQKSSLKPLDVQRKDEKKIAQKSSLILLNVQRKDDKKAKKNGLGNDKTLIGRDMRTTTEAGVDVSDIALWDSVDLNGDSSTATVMGMASGYGLEVYQRFLGSLRKSGYKGNIILGVAPDVDATILEYFKYRNVTAKVQKWVDCTYAGEDVIFNETTCAEPYPDIKIRWSRFPLARDWLMECKTCTGPVLIMDVRDSIFQLDPFGPSSPVIEGLQVYEEHRSQRTLHWLTDAPFSTCKNKPMNETMLCSGTTTGTRVAMLKYLEAMYEEMKVWINDPKCRFQFNGDDQAIHNWLFYTGQLPFAVAMPNRGGGVVNTVGVEGAILAKKHRVEMMEKYNIDQGAAMWKPFRGAGGKRWIGEEFNMTDDEGRFTEFDGSISRVIHQYDRFGRPFNDLWLRHQEFVKDPMPEPKSE